MSKNRILRLRIVLWACLLSIVVWLVFAALAPGGKKVYYSDFMKADYFIGPLMPKERLSTSSIEPGVLLVGDPVYFNLRTPRRFEKAKITLRYQRTQAQVAPVIELGMLADRVTKNYLLKSIDNQILEWLDGTWSKQTEGDVVLFTRQGHATSTVIKKYPSIKDFQNNLPPANRIAVYNYDLVNNFKLGGYQKSDKERVLTSKYLRGAFQILTYVNNEELDYKFNFIDLNQNKDKDDIEIYVYGINGDLVGKKNIPDPIDSADDNEILDRGLFQLKLPNLPEGVYKLEIKSSNDILIKKIETKQSKAVLLNKFWLANTDDEPVKLWTDTPVLGVETMNPAKLQSVKVGKNLLNLDKTYTLISRETGMASTVVEILKDDLLVAGEGVFAFRPEDYFSPYPKKLTPHLNLNKAGVDYVIARYGSSTKEREWSVGGAEFDLNNLVRHQGAYGFIISLSDLSGDSEGVLLKDIKIEMTGKSLWQKLKELIAKK